MENFSLTVTESKDNLSKTFNQSGCGNSVDNVGFALKDAIQGFTLGFDDANTTFRTGESWKQVLNEEFFSCLNAPATAVLSCFCGCCINANIQADLDPSTGWCCSCLCTGCCQGCDRNNVQRKLGVEEGYCVVNCAIRYFCFCCSLTQETRAVNQFVKVHRGTSDRSVPYAPNM